jgi:hypothetical protein
MKVTRPRLAVVGLLAAAAAVVSLLGARDVIAVPSPSSVIVVNGTDQPVPTAITGTPTVNVGGTVTVQPTRQPFQQFVSGFSSGGEDCDSIDVPAGKRLALESLSIDGDGSIEPHVYIRITVSIVGGANFVRAVEVDLQPAFSQWAGVANVLLHTGTPSPGVNTYTLDVCVAPGDGASSGSFRGFASGWIENV